MSARRVLVTGPVESLSDYSQAARAAGWEPVELSLLEVELLAVDAQRACTGAFDAIAITSGNVLPFLADAVRALPALARVPASVVGARTVERARAIGLAVDGTAASDADELARALVADLARGARVLWPHGDQSDELARVVSAHGIHVEAPLVYRVRPARGGEPPSADAVFFASPSAIRAWLARSTRASAAPPVAIAIGRTTHHALLAETALTFFDTISLPMPTPEAFAHVLGHLDPRARP